MILQKCKVSKTIYVYKTIVNRNEGFLYETGQSVEIMRPQRFIKAGAHAQPPS